MEHHLVPRLPALEPIRVGIVDDHPAIGVAIEAAAREDGDGRPIRIVGLARTIHDAIELVERTGPNAPDLLLCDLQVEGPTDGLMVIEAAAAAGRPSIAYTSHDRASLMRAVFEVGGAGFVAKGAEVRDVLAAIRTVAAGGTAFSAAAVRATRDAMRHPSAREVAVVELVAAGRTSDEIGHALGISGRTVESHLRRLFDRYGVVSRTELVVLAVREGWVEAGAG